MWRWRTRWHRGRFPQRAGEPCRCSCSRSRPAACRASRGSGSNASSDPGCRSRCSNRSSSCCSPWAASMFAFDSTASIDWPMAGSPSSITKPGEPCRRPAVVRSTAASTSTGALRARMARAVSSQPVRAVAYAQVKRGELKLLGLAADKTLALGVPRRHRSVVPTGAMWNRTGRSRSRHWPPRSAGVMPPSLRATPRPAAAAVCTPSCRIGALANERAVPCRTMMSDATVDPVTLAAEDSAARRDAAPRRHSPRF